MKLFSRLILLSLCLGLVPALGVADEFTPAEEEVCDYLLGPEYSPGLYGLCNAYCEAKDCDELGELEDQPRSCRRLHANFVVNATGPEDPEEPPCLDDVQEPMVPACPCWPADNEMPFGIPDALQMDALPLGEGSVGTCGQILIPGEMFYAAGIEDDNFFVQFLLDEASGVCDYLHSNDALSIPGVPVAGEGFNYFDDCKQGILFVQEAYLNNDCLVILPPPP